MSTISNTVTHSVYYGTGQRYTSPLTITNTGTVDVSIRSDAAVIGGGGTLVNNGRIVDSYSFATGVIVNAGGTVINTGLIQGYESGISITGVGVVINSGTIEAQNLGILGGGADVQMYGGTLTNTQSGYINLGVNLNVFSDGNGYDATVINEGTIANSDGIGIQLNSQLDPQGAIHTGTGTIVLAGSVFGGSGTTPDIAIYFGGTNALLVLQHGYSIHGIVDTAGNYAHTVELSGNAAAPVTVNFTPTEFVNFGTAAFAPDAGNDGTLVLAGSADIPGTIDGFTARLDAINLSYLSGHATAKLDPTTDQLTITADNGVAVLQLDPAEDYSGIAYDAIPDGNGTIVEIACFCTGTRIRTEAGDVPVEQLAIGDRLMTRSGALRPLKWIGKRSYAGWLAARNPKVLPICFKAGSLGPDTPQRDLWVSPEHAMYLDGALVPAGLLVNGVSILKAETIDAVHYIHLELDTHDVIIAEGALTESFVDDDSRGMFHNAADFHRLYPDTPAGLAARFCVPRIEDGFALEDIRRSLLARAAQLQAPLHPLRGQLEIVRRDRIAGWACGFDAGPVALTILANGAEIGRVVANRDRSDLVTDAVDDGHHAFDLVMAAGLAADIRHVIEVRRTSDWMALPDSPVVLDADGSVEAAGAVGLGPLRGSLDEAGHSRILGWAQDTSDTARAVGLVVSVDGMVAGRVLANRYRADLEVAGIGRGCHGFELLLACPLSSHQAHEIRVRREADGAELPGSPILVPVATGTFDAQAERALTGIVSRTGDEERILDVLLRETERLRARRAERLSGSTERTVERALRRRGMADCGTQLRRALVLDLRIPLASRDAGSVAILSHIHALKALGYAVTFVAAEEMGVQDALTALAAAEQITVCGAPFYVRVEDVLSRHAGGFDLIYLHRAAIADRYLPMARRYSPRARLVFSVADLAHLRLERQARLTADTAMLAQSRQMMAVEVSAARRADVVLTHSVVEAEMLRQRVAPGKVHVVPFAITLRPPREPFAQRAGIAVIGGAEHAPNPDAVEYLVRDILPRVWAQDPALRCKVVGHGWHQALLRGIDPRIEVVGPVANLDSIFDTVRLSVAPLRFGAGVKGKVLESLAAGVPCVMTNIASEGLPLSGTLSGLVGDGAEALADLILQFHADQGRNEDTGAAGRRMIARNFNAQSVAKALGAALRYAAPASLRAAQG